jgi:antitoxin component of RelBE/YafQ-DinJ toxin-antitoxin module
MNPKRVKINFRLNAETKRKAEKLADSLGISFNDVISLAVTEYLKAELKREPKP